MDLLVASPRVELGHPYEYWILSPARLPIPPKGHSNHPIKRVVVTFANCLREVFLPDRELKATGSLTFDHS